MSCKQFKNLQICFCFHDKPNTKNVLQNILLNSTKNYSTGKKGGLISHLTKLKLWYNFNPNSEN